MPEKQRKKSIHLSTIINYIILTMIVISCLYPFLNVIAYSLSSNKAILTGIVTIYPVEIQFNAYEQILSKNTIWNSMKNTVVIALYGTGLGLLLTTCAAYALSKKRLKGRKFLTFFFLFSMYFVAGIIPTFLVVKSLNLLNKLHSLVLPVAMSSFNFIVMKSFFVQLPDELEEQASIDGCNEIGILVRIILPLSMPIIATIGLFYAVYYWNEFFNSLMYITDPMKFPLQLRLRQLLFTEALSALGENANSENLGQMVLPESLKAASVIVSTIPIIIIYPWLQKYFVKGMLLGSVKG